MESIKNVADRVVRDAAVRKAEAEAKLAPQKEDVPQRLRLRIFDDLPTSRWLERSKR